MVVRGLDHPPERRTGYGRRKVDIPTDWPEAREHIRAEFLEIWGSVGQVSDDVHAIRQLLERNSWRVGVMWAVGITLATTILGAGSYLGTQYLKTELIVAAESRQEHRLDIIADALWDIPQGSAYRVQSGPRAGSPRVHVLQRMLPDMPSITARERDAACLRAPEACR